MNIIRFVSIRRSVLTVAVLVNAFAIISPLRMTENSLAPAVRAQREAAAVIFAVSGEADDYHMDAVALINGKQFIAPFI